MTDFAKGNPLFKTREGLEAEIARLKLPIRLEPDIKKALEPTEVGGRRIGNRFVVHPMEGCDGKLDGRPDEITYHRWGRFARGGCKLLWGEATAVVPEGRANTRQLWINDSNVDDFTRLIEWSREEHRKAWGNADDFVIGLQLTHSGRFSFPDPSLLSHEPAWDGFTRAGKERRPIDDAYPVMTDDDLDRLQDAYVAAARLAVRAGVDFIDLKQCHRYLLSELLASKKRPGKYGGSLENRTRLACSVFRRIRDEFGSKVFLATRMNLFDSVPFQGSPGTVGTPVEVDTPFHNAFGANPDRPTEPDLTEPLEAIRLFTEAGVALVNGSIGSPYCNPHYLRPADTPPPDGYAMPESGLVGMARHFELAEKVQRTFPDLAVVGSGYSYLRHFAPEAGEANLRDGRISLVGIGRGAIAYPDFVRDLVDGKPLARDKACITVSYCTSLMRAKGNELGQYAAGCVPRDPLYAKLYQELRQSERVKK